MSWLTERHADACRLPDGGPRDVMTATRFPAVVEGVRGPYRLAVRC